MSRPNVSIAVFLSKTLGAVAAVTCEAVGRVAKGEFNVKLNQPRSFDKSNLSAQTELFAKIVSVPMNAPSQFEGKDVLCGTMDENFVLNGRVVEIGGIAPVRFTNVDRREDAMTVDDITAIMFVSADEQTMTGTFSVREVISGDGYGGQIDITSPVLLSGLEEVEALFRQALDRVETIKEQVMLSGSVQDDDSSVTLAVNEDRELILHVSGNTTIVNADQMASRIDQRIRAVLQKGIKKAQILEKKRKLEAELNAVDNELQQHG